MLTKKQQKAVKLLASSNMTQKEIAAVVKVSENTISTWKKSADFIEAYNNEINTSLKYVSQYALRTVVNLMTCEDDRVRLGAAKDILDRAGFKGIENIKLDANVNPFSSLTDAELKKLISDG